MTERTVNTWHAPDGHNAGKGELVGTDWEVVAAEYRLIIEAEVGANRWEEMKAHLDYLRNFNTHPARICEHDGVEDASACGHAP